MDLEWIFLQILQPFTAVAGALCFSRFFLPLRRGLREEDQKLINKGSAYFVGFVLSVVLYIYCVVNG